ASQRRDRRRLRRGRGRLRRRLPEGFVPPGNAACDGPRAGGDTMSFLPVKVCEFELSEPVSGITAPGHESALVLARWYCEPLAVVDIPLPAGTADAGQG